MPMTCRSSGSGGFTVLRRRHYATTLRETGFRSKYEGQVSESLSSRAPDAKYEAVRIPYQVIRNTFYVPDWILPKQAIVLEAKGWFRPADRTKMLLLKQQYPALDIRLVLQTPQKRLTSKSRTTYAAWCEQHGFPWCKGPELPPDWLKHKPKKEQREAFNGLFSALSK